MPEEGGKLEAQQGGERSTEDEIAALAAHLDAAQHRLLSLIRAFDASGAWYSQGATSCAAWLNWKIGVSPVAARDKVRVARTLGKLPLIDAAMERGILSYSKVRALTRVATADNEAALLNMARNATAAQLEKICRGVRRVVDPSQAEEANLKVRSSEAQRGVWLRSDGEGELVHVHAQLRADEAMRVMQAAESARDGLHAEQRAQGPNVGASAEASSSRAASQDSTLHTTLHACDGAHASNGAASAEALPAPNCADGLVHIAETFLLRAEDDAGASPKRATSAADRHELIVHLAPSLFEEDHYDAFLDDGTRLSGAALRRIACDAGIVPVAVDEQGEPLNVGRKTRSIPPAIRRALHVRDRGACAFPGCNHTRFLDSHHIEHWADGGETKLANLVLLCSRHHALHHEGGYSIEHDDNGALLFCAPGGRRIPSAPRPPDVPADAVGALKEAHSRLGLRIDHETSRPESHTASPDYEMCALAGSAPQPA